MTQYFLNPLIDAHSIPIDWTTESLIMHYFQIPQSLCSVAPLFPMRLSHRVSPFVDASRANRPREAKKSGLRQMRLRLQFKLSSRTTCQGRAFQH